MSQNNVRRLLRLVPLCASTACLAQVGTAQLYGVVDLSLNSRQLSGQARTDELMNGAMTTSFIGLRGREDLGGGYGALFALESFLRADTGSAGRTSADAHWSRNAWVGLATPLGTWRLGRQSTPAFLLGNRTNPFGGATGVGPYMMHSYMPSVTQPMITANGTGDSAWSNALSLTSPEFNGTSVALLGALSEGTANGRRWSVAVNHTGGPWSGGLVVETISDMNLPWGAPAPTLATPARPLWAASDVQVVLGGLSYDFGDVKAFAQWQAADLTSATSADTTTLRTTQLGSSVRVGAGQVLLSWARTSADLPAGGTQRRDTVALGYDHWLSRRTDVYAVLLHDVVTRQDGGSSLAVGVRHSF